jgi:LmbE family N-acetylglucosaminyl deacetylase
VAHPDDEVIGVGSRLNQLKRAQFIYTTDGAPRDMLDARRLGFSQRDDYISARRKERCCVFQNLGISTDQILELGYVDQEIAFHLLDLTEKLLAIFEEKKLQFIITHAYEGGHPDHDGTAFAVHIACELLRNRKKNIPNIFEIALYHDRSGRMITNRFCDDPKIDATTWVLTPEERAFKKRLFNCFETQRQVLSYFPIEIEQFRCAPQYDFTKPPQGGEVFYDRHSLGLKSDGWIELAQKVLKQLGLSGKM